ncbi:dihydrofolate reductase family protein [Deinococcus apachensis]|uniref:dihydrofolate reductase family protein n=1 Tax=Deinococcus apachensis TaxID=309886 RepID=UPI00037F1F0A|nr:dihydrofolate reductase family protein [Deinococcus apachensis]
MRRLIVLERITLDGVFDAASMGQWDFPYHSDERAEVISWGSDAYLLGRVTYKMLAPHWSALGNNEMGVADKLNSMRKYVVSSNLEKAEWNNTTIIRGDAAEEVGQLKWQEGGDILVQGSAVLLQVQCHSSS